MTVNCRFDRWQRARPESAFDLRDVVDPDEAAARRHGQQTDICSASRR